MGTYEISSTLKSIRLGSIIMEGWNASHGELFLRSPCINLNAISVTYHYFL